MTINQSLAFGIGTETAMTILEHESNPYYARAIHSTNFEQAKALRIKAMRAKADHLAQRPKRHVPMPVSEADDLNAWLTDVAATAAEETNWHAQTEALDALILECERRIQGVALDRDGILTSLAADLDNLLEEARQAITKLGGARTPTEVIAAGTGDAWTTLLELRTQYDDIRAAQDFATLNSPDYSSGRSNYLWDDPHANDNRIGNLDDIFPGWRDGTEQAIRIRGNGDRPQPWPDETVAQLVWLIDNNAQLWIPTQPQLDNLWAERRRLRNPEPKVIPTRPDRPWQLTAAMR